MIKRELTIIGSTNHVKCVLLDWWNVIKHLKTATREKLFSVLNRVAKLFFFLFGEICCITNMKKKINK